jgi:hypothetical protein
MHIYCRGGWVGCKVLASPAYNDFTCLAIGHPSVHLEEYAFKKSTQELFDAVQKPLLLQPARVSFKHQNFLCFKSDSYISLVIGRL